MEMPLSKQQLEKLFKERLKTVHQTQPLLKVEMDMGPASDFPTKRDYGYCLSDGKNALIVFAPKILKAPKAQVDALMRHELAHAYLIAAKLNHSERECDSVAHHLFGDPIYYDEKDVQTLDRSKAKSSIRPSYLPNPRANPPVQNPPSLLNEKYAEGMRDYLTRFSGADAFARSVSRPPLAQSVSNVAGIMDAASYTRLDMDHIRDVLESYADWYFLYEIPVDEADWQALHTSTSPVHVVEPSGKEDLTKPIIVGSDGEVIDGRHRVLLARKRGIEVLPAYIPADRLYALLMGETQ
jgi:hypothetical protein